MHSKIKLIQGDITELKVDAIVNAANSTLLGGGGVDGAIHRAGGKAVLEACIAIKNRQGGCKTGEAVITTAGNLPAKYVIHTVGPIWKGGTGKEEMLLASAYRNSLLLTIEHDIQTVAFPNISTGVYCYPKNDAARIAVETVTGFLQTNEHPQQVIFVCFDLENYGIYERLLAK